MFWNFFKSFCVVVLGSLDAEKYSLQHQNCKPPPIEHWECIVKFLRALKKFLACGVGEEETESPSTLDIH